MTLYQNGRIPQGNLIKIASGTDVNGYWEHLISPATLRKWNAALAYARRKWGKVMRISTGWNVYRPYDVQVAARKRAEARGTPNVAARPGWSSHGGTWQNSTYTRGVWVDALAIDVVRQELTWAQVDEAMRHAGFLVGAITKAIAGIDEPWHYIDLDPWAAVPADVTPEEEDVIESLYTLFRKTGGQPVPAGAEVNLHINDKAHVSVARGAAKHLTGNLSIALTGGKAYRTSVQVIPVLRTIRDGKEVKVDSLRAQEITFTAGDTLGKIPVDCVMRADQRLSFRIGNAGAAFTIRDAIFRGMRAN